MENVLNFGIVGSGMIANIHARCIAELPGARVAAVCGNHRSRAEMLASPYGAKVYTDYQHMLADPNIHAVCIVTPSGTHAELGIAAALAGKHILVEKPIDISLEKADQLIDTCRACGVKLCCIFQHRYDQAIVELKKAVDAGRLGQLNFGASHTKWYRSQEYYDSSPWRGTWAMDGGGALINQSIHYVDLLHYIMGPVDEVYAYCVRRAHERIEVEDLAVAAVKFSSGAVGIIEGTTAAFPGFHTQLDIFGTDGSIVIENDAVKEWKLKNGAVCEPVPSETNRLVGASGSDISHQSHKRQIDDFLTAVRSNAEPLVDGLEARKTLEIVLAVYESARTGKPVRMREIRGSGGR